MDIKFGTDGWRGVIAREFTFDNVRKVAQAVADYVRAEAEKPGQNRKQSPLAKPIWISYDRRFGSENFAREVAKVLGGNRLTVLLTPEPMPTPSLSFLTQKTDGLGVMVTASHNPPPYNGIKLKYGGRSATEPLTQAVESQLEKNPVSGPGPFREKPCRKEYLQYLRGRADLSKIASRLKRPVVLDFMHGAAAGFLEELLPAKRLVVIRDRRDPLFGGINPEPIEANLAMLTDAVKQSKALVGIALDGDGDRIGLVDDLGNYFTPCQVFPMILSYLLGPRKLSGKIVQSVSMGYLSARIARERQLQFEELPVGFKHVAEQLALGQAVAGGEESGGYAWKGTLPERDGLVSAMLILEMCAVLGKTPSQIWKEVEAKHGKSHFKRVDMRIHRAPPDKAAFTARMAKKLPKKILGMAPRELLQFDGLKVILENDFWLLIRTSGTEPLLRVYAETESPKQTEELLALAQKITGGVSL